MTQTSKRLKYEVRHWLDSLPKDENSNNAIKYLELLEDRCQWLRCLESAGVDNWEGYEFAQEAYNTLMSWTKK